MQDPSDVLHHRFDDTAVTVDGVVITEGDVDEKVKPQLQRMTQRGAKVPLQ